MNANEDHSFESSLRLRWTTIDMAVEEGCNEDNELCSSSSSNTASFKTTYYLPKRMLKTYAVLLKRLLKPMYVQVAHALNNLHEDYYSIHRIDECPSDSRIYVDMEDKTMWMEVEPPMLIDDFYKFLVSNDLANGKYSGYDIDDKPSINMVSLSELKRTLVGWYCN